MGGKGDTSGNHENDSSELLAGFLDAEGPRDQEDSDWGKGLGILNQ